MVTKKEYFRPGSFWRISDRSGFKERAEDTQKEWTGLIVGKREWEPRNQQDFVKGVKDKQNSPEPRPRQTDVFVGPIFVQLTANALVGAVALTVDTTQGISNGDLIGVMLDSGVIFRTSVRGPPANLTITIPAGLPSQASSGNLVERFGPGTPYGVLGTEDGGAILTEDGNYILTE